MKVQIDINYLLNSSYIEFAQHSNVIEVVGSIQIGVERRKSHWKSWQGY